MTDTNNIICDPCKKPLCCVGLGEKKSTKYKTLTKLLNKCLQNFQDCSGFKKTIQILFLVIIVCIDVNVSLSFDVSSKFTDKR